MARSLMVYWVAVEEFYLSYSTGESLLFTVHARYGCNLSS